MSHNLTLNLSHLTPQQFAQISALLGPQPQTQSSSPEFQPTSQSNTSTEYPNHPLLDQQPDIPGQKSPQLPLAPQNDVPYHHPSIGGLVRTPEHPQHDVPHAKPSTNGFTHPPPHSHQDVPGPTSSTSILSHLPLDPPRDVIIKSKTPSIFSGESAPQSHLMSFTFPSDAMANSDSTSGLGQ